MFNDNLARLVWFLLTESQLFLFTYYFSSFLNYINIILYFTITRFFLNVLRLT